MTSYGTQSCFWSMAADPRNAFRCSFNVPLHFVGTKILWGGDVTQTSKIWVSIVPRNKVVRTLQDPEATISDQIGRRGPESCHGTRGIVSLQMGGENCFSSGVLVQGQPDKLRRHGLSSLCFSSAHANLHVAMVKGVVDMCAGFLAQT